MQVFAVVSSHPQTPSNALIASLTSTNTKVKHRLDFAPLTQERKIFNEALLPVPVGNRQQEGTRFRSKKAAKGREKLADCLLLSPPLPL